MVEDLMCSNRRVMNKLLHRICHNNSTSLVVLTVSRIRISTVLQDTFFILVLLHIYYLERETYITLDIILKQRFANLLYLL